MPAPGRADTEDMNGPRPASGKALLVVLVLAALGGIGAVLVVNAPDHVTEFAPEYTAAAFDSIHVGLAEASVLELVGEPLEKSSDDKTMTWTYARPTGDPEHTVIRRVAFDRRLRTVVRIDRHTRFDYFGQLFSDEDDGDLE